MCFLMYDDKIKEALEEVERLESMQSIIEHHPYKITYSESRRMWETYVKHPDGAKRVTSRKKEDFYKKLIDHYTHPTKYITVADAYTEWMNERIKYNEIKPQSITRIQNNYKRLFLGNNNKIYARKIWFISEEEIRIFIKDTLLQFHLTRKGFADFKTLIRGIWRYAYNKNYTTIKISQLITELYITKNMIKPTEKHGKKEVFFRDEAETIIEFLKQSKILTDKGLLLMFQTGMRVGELSALTVNDIGTETIHVNKTEIHFTNDTNHDTVEIANTPKTEAGNRFIILTDYSKQTVNDILELRTGRSEYLFERKNGTRIAGQCFNRRLRRVCEKLGIPPRSCHKIRKTFATRLINGNVDESLIVEQMGHSDISTTRRYYYRIDQTDEEKIRQMKKALDY